MLRRALLSLAVAAAVAACDPAPPAPPPVATTPPAAGPSPPAASDPAKALAEAGARMTVEERRAVWNEHARGLLKSFEARCYDPRRDGRLDRAEGAIDVRVGDLEARYTFVLDPANPESDPVTWTVVTEPKGFDATLARRARSWAVQSCLGAFPVVAFYRPPIALRVEPASDPGSKNLIVVAPEFRGPLSVSYSFDDRQVVAARGEWTSKTVKVATRYEWELWHNRYVVRQESYGKDSTVDYEYDAASGALLLTKVHFREGARAVEAVLTYPALTFRAP